MTDLISRAAAIEAIKPLLYSGNCVSTLINMPAVDAIPVEWLRNLCAIAKMETDDEMFIDWLIQTWQEEQEAQDG